MKRLIVLLLLTAPAYAEEYDAIKGIRPMIEMHNAYQWGRVQNKIAAEAPPERHQVEIINRNPAPRYNYDSNAELTAMVEAMKKDFEAKKPVEYKDSPFFSK